MTSILTDFTAYLKQQQEKREAALPVVVAQLQAIGRAIIDQLPDSITAIEVEYWGSGDEGSMEEMRVLPQKDVPDGEPRVHGTNGLLDHCDLPEKVTLTLPGEDEEQEYDVRQAIEDLAFEILENCHPGWEISDGEAEGGSGTVSLDFPSLKVRLAHQANYIASHDYEHNWEVAS